MRRRTKGFSLIDVIVGTALLLILFLALFGLLRASFMVSSIARAKAGAATLAETQMEYLRGLAYASLGTVGGIPAGAVPQDATTTENGVPYAIHTFIGYVDDPADGLGSADSNGITTDYKRAEVTVSFLAGGQEKTVSLVSNFAPPGIETSTGGGTLEVDAVDATGAPVPSATVTVTNDSSNPPVALSTFTNTAGIVSLPGAAASPDYQVVVSKYGYSSARTYARDTTNQNPNPGYLTVVANQTTVGTFAIDLLGTLNLETLEKDGAATTTLPSVSFTLSGAKTIGSAGDGTPIYKTTETTSTNGSGTASLPLEWDRYALTVPNYDIVDACPLPPYALAPGSSFSASVTLGTATANSLRVFVTDSSGTAVSGAAVTLSRTGFSATALSSSCGVAYFGDLSSASDYTVTIVKDGYTTTGYANVSVSGASTYGAGFP